MVIQHNIMALNAYRYYNANTSALAKNLEKLSSGYQINSAGDDAAGLAISEKMRAQITGLEAAQKNVSDGTSLAKTAEGAMQEIQDMLNRMEYLATQSANGTYDNEVDRANLQKEVSSLRTEIDRIADSSNFNGIKLLDGSMDGATETQITLGKASTLVAEGATAGKTQGTNTILHVNSSEAKPLTFDWDLSNVTVALNADEDSGTLTIGVGSQTGMDVTVTEAMSSEDVAKAVYDALAGVATAASEDIATDGVELSTGVKFTVELDGDVLHFTMSDDTLASTTSASAFVKTPSVSLSASGATLGSTDTDYRVSNVSSGVPAGGDVLADTVSSAFTTVDDITDKLGIKLGDTTYVLALTEDTLNTDYGDGYKVVDLTDLVDKTTGKISESKLPGTSASSDNVIQAALNRISEAAADNEMWSVQVDAGNKRLTFREKETYDGDADLTTLEGIQSQIQEIATVTAKSVKTGKGSALTLQIGDTADTYNQMSVSISDMHSDALGIGDLDISTQEGAQAAIDVIKNAINSVSSTRGDLGAIQNRLDHTANNLSVMVENITDAESTIRDTDVAEEMMAYTKNNILVQSAQAMLAQANAVPQGVLQLLQ